MITLQAGEQTTVAFADGGVICEKLRLLKPHLRVKAWMTGDPLKRPVGRPRQFTTAEVLNSALEVFWERGYAATSVEDIVAATGLKKASLYASFGNKHDLFVKVCRFYRENFETVCGRSFKTQAGLKGIKDFFYSEIDDLTADAKRRGCLMINTIVGDYQHDPEVAAEWQGFLQRLEASFHAALQAAATAKTLKPGLSLVGTARYLLTLTQGIMLSAKAGLANKQLKDIVKIAMQGLELGP